ncbi:Aquaporin Z [Pirellula sp. SH-Sr6A]|uniref:MIP/aquaporin family protein n=1 Tax=Pirellula sp. SH-Sr6A TaxID=1632865 RepID=UPI00078E84D3|nr:aquaporin [Pirellula sp. SH-Sr6A]AMV33689.1 Aquaporin Z [Pirellula sp. SH-Sr6A]
MDLWQRLVAECFGTYSLVLAGTGAIVINHVSHGQITHVGIAITFGLIVLALIYAIGEISGCHLNPAVTAGLFLSGRFGRGLVVPYMLSQIAGACLASLTMRALFPDHRTLGATLPSGSILQSFVLELNLTLLLMFVILCVTRKESPNGMIAGIAIGSVIALEAMFAGPISGASMNPARSIGPALITMNLTSLWVYIIAPCIGSALAVPLYGFVYHAKFRAHPEKKRPI